MTVNGASTGSHARSNSSESVVDAVIAVIDGLDSDFGTDRILGALFEAIDVGVTVSAHGG